MKEITEQLWEIRSDVYRAIKRVNDGVDIEPVLRSIESRIKEIRRLRDTPAALLRQPLREMEP